MKQFILAVLLFGCTLAKAQVSIEGGVFLGASIYNGDIDVTFENFLPQMRPAGGVFGRYYLWKNLIAARGSINFAQVFGDEGKFPSSTYRKTRGFNFNTNLTEFSLLGELHLLRLDRTLRYDRDNTFISIFGFGGLAGILFNPKTDFNEPNPYYDSVSIDKNANFPKNAYVLVGGVGIKMQLTETLSVGAELSARRANTDYLDGISKLAGPRVKDYYFLTGLTLSKTFGGIDSGLVGGSRNKGWKSKKNVGCPTF